MKTRTKLKIKIETSNFCYMPKCGVINHVKYFVSG